MAENQAQSQATTEESADLSDALFSMYLNRAHDEDKEMVEGWKEDANGMLTFVRLQIASHSSAYNIYALDWSILCCGCGIARVVRTKPSAEFAGHLEFLSRKYLSTTEWVQSSHPVELGQPHRAIFSDFLERLGQLPLDLESGH